ncbi:hypothetical protein ACH5RR_013200 [Cinchona calisaya]|uniref:Auxin-responsive protein n=1 Tax=Cinchona calisaya TaxID=153742 RepID=A0ABD3A0Q0_9GENT
MKVTTDLIEEDLKGSSSRPQKDEAQNMASPKVSLLDVGSSQSGSSSGVQSGLASRWASMKAGFQNFKANMGSKMFLPLRQVQETQVLSRTFSSESLDDVFQRLKRPSAEHGNYSNKDED